MTDDQGPELPIVLDPEDLAAVVAHFAASPSCATCGGRAEVRPGRGGCTDVIVWHVDGCEAAAKAVECGARPVDVRPQVPGTFRSLG